MSSPAFNALLDMNIFLAMFTYLDTLLGGWFIGVMFVVFQILVQLKTRTLELTWVIGFFFVVLYAGSGAIVGDFTTQLGSKIMMIVLVFELAPIMYGWLFK